MQPVARNITQWPTAWLQSEDFEWKLFLQFYVILLYSILKPCGPQQHTALHQTMRPSEVFQSQCFLLLETTGLFNTATYSTAPHRTARTVFTLLYPVRFYARPSAEVTPYLWLSTAPDTTAKETIKTHESINPQQIRPWSEHESVSPQDARSRRLHLKVAPQHHPNFTEYFGRHEQWRSNCTKYCACNEKNWRSNITPTSPSIAPALKSDSDFTKYYACHEKWISTITPTSPNTAPVKGRLERKVTLHFLYFPILYASSLCSSILCSSILHYSFLYCSFLCSFILYPSILFHPLRFYSLPFNSLLF